MTALSARLFRPLDRRAAPARDGVGRAAFGFDDVARARQQPGGAALQGAGGQHADAVARARLRRLPRHPLPAREGALARREAAVRADVLPPGAGGSGAGRGSTSSSRPASAPSPFDPALFDYGKNKFEPQTLQRRRLQRLSRPLRRSTSRATRTRSLVFQGASYFRAVGKGQSYGLSARGLAVDTAAPTGEEFPRFVEFWIERPRAQRHLADDLCVARLAPRRRRLPLRADAGRRDDDAGDARGSTCARRSASSAWRR